MKFESESDSIFRCLLIPASFTTSIKIIDASSKSSLIYPSFADDFSTLDIYQLFHTFTYWGVDIFHKGVCKIVAKKSPSK